MAKDLPFFKFYCSEWNDGDITLEDYNVQGVFINVCSYYWSKECTVTEKVLKKRFRDCIDVIDLLVKENHLKVVGGEINITFLDEQYSEVENTSSARSKAGKKSARIKKIRKEIIEQLTFISTETNISLTELEKEYNINSTSVDFLLQQNSTIKIRGEEIRRDKKRKDDEERERINNINVDSKEVVNGKFYQINQLYNKFVEEVKKGEHAQAIERLYMRLKVKPGTLADLVEDFQGQLINEEKLHQNTLEFRKHFGNWLNIQENIGKLDQYKNIKKQGAL